VHDFRQTRPRMEEAFISLIRKRLEGTEHGIRDTQHAIRST